MRINATSTLLLSIRNADTQPRSGSQDTLSAKPSARPPLGHVSFQSHSIDSKPPLPISLLVRIDEDEYIILQNVSSLVSVRVGDLDPAAPHDVRIIAPMTDGTGFSALEFQGIWLSRGGHLMRLPGSQLQDDVDYEDTLQAENESVGEKHRLGLHELHQEDVSAGNHGQDSQVGGRKKVLEIVTDAPGALQRRERDGISGSHAGILGGVMGWEYLLGEMFGVDHVGVGIDGMCLVQDCIGGTGAPAGLSDVYFRR